MTLIAVFGGCLLLSVLVSATPARPVLSVAVIFLVAGAFAARLGWVTLRPDSPVVDTVIDLALFAVLFAEGRALPRAAVVRWPVVLRGVTLGLLMAAATLFVARGLLGFGWIPAALVAAVLATTGPMVAGFTTPRLEPVMTQLRAVSAVTAAGCVVAIGLLTTAAGQRPVSTAVLPVVGGLALGVALPALVHLLVRLPDRARDARRRGLTQLAVAVLLFAVAQLTGVDPALAAFVGGAVLTRLDPVPQAGFAEVTAPQSGPGGMVDQLAGLSGAAALLVFGTLLTPALVRGTPALAWAAAALVVVAIRPLATAVGLIGTTSARQALGVGWLAPQPFLPTMLTLLVLRSGLPNAPALYAFLAVTIVAAVLVHAVTDVVVTRSVPVGSSAGNAT